MPGQIPPKAPPPMLSKPWHPDIPTPRPKYRQRVILQAGGQAFKTALDDALRDGWTIEQIGVNSEANHWIGIVGKV